MRAVCCPAADAAGPGPDEASEARGAGARQAPWQEPKEVISDGDEEQLRPEAMLPAHVPSVIAFQSLVDTYAKAKKLRSSPVHPACWRARSAG